GERSLWLKNMGPRTASWMTSIPVVPGAKYRIVVHAWAKNNRGATTINIRGRDAKGGWVSGSKGNSKDQEVFVTESTSDWQELDARFTFPDGTDNRAVLLSNQLGNGDEVWFDDFQVFDNVVPSYLA